MLPDCESLSIILYLEGFLPKYTIKKENQSFMAKLRFFLRYLKQSGGLFDNSFEIGIYKKLWGTDYSMKGFWAL